MGKTEARETDPVGPVSEADVEAIRPHVSATIWSIIQVQRLCGCRPTELLQVKGADIDRSGPVWEYRPASHKNTHRGKPRTIFFGPKTQAILTEFLRPGYLFSPRLAVAKQLEERHANRKTPMSCGNKPGSNRRKKPKHPPGEFYDVATYRRAIHRACDLAFPPPVKLADDEATQWRRDHRWSPNQLRHATGTAVRKAYGLEGAQVVLGHSAADVTQVSVASEQALQGAPIDVEAPGDHAA